jgi:preprotein translocase subunit SecG
MNVLLTFALMIGAPVVGLVLAARLESKKAAAIASGDYGSALNHEDTAYALRAIGWFVSGMMAMALLVSPFVGGYGS